MMMGTGQITLDGRPLRDAEVLRIDGVTPTALVRSDANGRYTLPESPGDRLVVRVRTPIVGVWIADAATEKFELQRSELVRVRLDFRVPEGVTFDWLDVKLTPRREEVPPRVILATGVEPGLAEGMYGVRITEPHLELELRPGLYDLRAHRVIYDTPKGAPMTSLMADTVVTDGPTAVPKFGGFEVELGAARKLAVALRLMRPEEL
jgi:hypothetical protein